MTKIQNVDFAKTSTTKKTKETKHGARKGSASPGDHSNSLKVR